MNTLEQNASKKYTPWLILTLLDFVTIISFENIFYPFQNQGLSVVISWIFMLFAYVIPYELIVSQLGLTFDQQSRRVGVLDQARNRQRSVRICDVLDVLGSDDSVPR